MKETDFV